MSQIRHDWADLEHKWITGKWQTLEEMAKQTKISIQMIQKNSSLRKWKDKKQQVDDIAEQEAIHKIGISYGRKIAEANERALKTAKILQTRGLVRFIYKDGRVKKTKMDSDSAAVTAIRAGIAIEQSILKNYQLDGAPPAQNTEININAQQNNYNAGEMSDDELAAVIRNTGNRIREIESRRAAKAPKRSSKNNNVEKKGARKSP